MQHQGSIAAAVTRAGAVKRVLYSLGLALLLGVAGCGGGDTPPAAASAVIGPLGGTLTGPDGVQVVIPAGALDRPTEIRIARSAIGAPATLPEDYTATAAALTYEFTPHGLVFNTPVSIRVPTASSATNAEVLMASPGEDWQVQDATVSGGYAEWQRNSFSWGIHGLFCSPTNSAPYSASNPDPYPCSLPRGAANASATPASAITRRDFGGQFSSGNGSAGSWTVNQAATVRMTLTYSAAPDCQNPRAKLLRVNTAVPLNTPGRVQTLFDGPVTLTTTTLPFPSGIGTYVRGVGSTNYDVAFTHLDNGTSAFGYSFTCNRPSRTARGGGDLLTFIAAIPVPSATYAIGGTVSGLTGAGLVLQNNGANNLAVTADGAFGFATPVGAGAPYNVTVLTQPGGQTCTVLNGSGAASAVISNVAVTCTTPPVAVTWSAPVAISPAGVQAYSPAAAAARDGGATLAWVQYDAADQQFNGYASRFDTAGNAWRSAELFETLMTNTGASLSQGVDTPRIAMADNQRAHIAFGFSLQPGNFQAGMSRFDGSGWTAQTLTAGSNATDATLAFTADGSTAVVMYTQVSGSLYTARSQAFRYDNATLTVISPDGGLAPGDATRPAMAPLGSNEAVAVWTTSATSVWANRFSAATQSWATPVQLKPSTRSNVFPVEASANAAGTAVAFWLDLDNGYQVYASRMSTAGWTAPVALASQADVRRYNQDLSNVATGVDVSGNAYFAWGQADPVNSSLYQIRLRRCAIAQAMSSCGAVEVVDSQRAGPPALVVGPTGDLWVAWVSTTPLGVAEIRVRRQTAGVWSPVVTLGASAQADVPPAIAVDGLNRATVAWKGADQRIQVARSQ